MAIAGTLAVNIVARTNKFIDGIKKARKGLGGFQNAVSASQRVLSGFSGALIGTIGVGSMIAYTKSVINTAAELGNVADKLGISTDKLEEMRFAAEQTGVSFQTLQMGLQRMVRRVGQAAQGTGEAKDTLEQLNLNARRLNQLDPAAMFQRIARAIQSIPDRGGQLAAMQKIFDSEGVALINLAAEGVERYSEAFQRAGGPTGEAAVRRAQEFALAMNEIKGAVAGFGRDFVLDISPQLKDSIDVIKDALQVTGVAPTPEDRLPFGARLRELSMIIGHALASGERAAPILRGGGQTVPATGVAFFNLERQAETRKRIQEQQLREQQRQTALQEEQLRRTPPQDARPTINFEPATFQ